MLSISRLIFFIVFLNFQPGLLVDSLAPNKSHSAKEQRPKAALRVQHAEIALHSSTVAEVNLQVLRGSPKSCFPLHLIRVEKLQFKVWDTARFRNFKQIGAETCIHQLQLLLFLSHMQACATSLCCFNGLKVTLFQGIRRCVEQTLSRRSCVCCFLALCPDGLNLNTLELSSQKCYQTSKPT